MEDNGEFFDIDGKDVSLSKFKGKVLLIVNVASRCGLTTSNYTELSHIYEKYKNQGWIDNVVRSSRRIDPQRKRMRQSKRC